MSLTDYVQGFTFLSNVFRIYKVYKEYSGCLPRETLPGGEEELLVLTRDLSQGWVEGMMIRVRRRMMVSLMIRQMQRKDRLVIVFEK